MRAAVAGVVMLVLVLLLLSLLLSHLCTYLQLLPTLSLAAQLLLLLLPACSL